MTVRTPLPAAAVTIERAGDRIAAVAARPGVGAGRPGAAHSADRVGHDNCVAESDCAGRRVVVLGENGCGAGLGIAAVAASGSVAALGAGVGRCQPVDDDRATVGEQQAAWVASFPARSASPSPPSPPKK